MADAATIILDLYRQGEIRKACLTITGNDQLWRDLEQETVLILLEKDPDKIVKMHQAQYLRFYIVRLIINLYRGKNNQFHAKFRHHEERVEVDPQAPDNSTEYNTLLDDLWEIAQQEIDSWAKDGAFPYDKELLNLLMQTGNMKAMSRETGIPYRSIIYSIEQAKVKIKNSIESHGYTGLSHPD